MRRQAQGMGSPQAQTHPAEGPRPTSSPLSASHALRSATWFFSHCVIDCVSLSLILLFMQVQYFSTTSSAAPPLLSETHWLIHLTSSVVAAPALAAANAQSAAIRMANVSFMMAPPHVFRHSE